MDEYIEKHLNDVLMSIRNEPLAGSSPAFGSVGERQLL
ncbi:hypothetical protein M2133_001382 [Parabacteroides sp. PF5-6]|nr:hypothetical protein [Parabacteroides sp. PF5-6]